MKPKGKFIIIETALVRSEQLSSSEKLLYMALITYRHNSPPVQCNPSLPTLQKSTGLSKPTLLKAKRLLQIKGLIKCQAGGGRTITTRYAFPLEEGKEEEIQKLTAYLNAKKTGKKLNPLIEQKQVKNNTALEPNSEQKTGKKLNREQEVSLKKQQQKADGAVSSPSHNQKNELKVKRLQIYDLIKSLGTLGIRPGKTEDLIRRYGLDNVQKQYTWLFLRNVTYPAGALIASLEEDWPQPVKVMRGAEMPKILGPEKDSVEYKRQYECLKKASKQRGRLDMERRRKGKTGKKLNPYNSSGPAPYFADQVPDEVCKNCPLQYDSHPLEHKTHGRLICLRRDVKAGLVGVLFTNTNGETGQKLNQLKQNGISKRRAQPAVP